MSFINLTPHEIVLEGKAFGARWVFPPSDMVARCETVRKVVDEFELEYPGDYEGVTEWCEVPIHSVGFGVVSGLPDPTPGVMYLVSSIVAQAVPNRRDVLVPDDTIRDEGGRVVGCRAFARLVSSKEVQECLTH